MNIDLKKFLQSEGLLLPDIQPKGWECPKCGRVYSPTTPMCFYCGGEQTVTATSVTGGTKTGEPEDTYCTDENCEIFQRDLNCERCNR